MMYKYPRKSQSFFLLQICLLYLHVFCASLRLDQNFFCFFIFIFWKLPFLFWEMQKEETGMARSKEEMESGSGSEHIEGMSGNEQEAEQQPQPKKKRYHRHTVRQIQEMESYDFFSNEREELND